MLLKKEENMLKRWRAFRGLRVIDLSLMTDIPESRLHRAEQDRIVLTSKECRKVAEILDAPIEELEAQEEARACTGSREEAYAVV